LLRLQAGVAVGVDQNADPLLLWGEGTSPPCVAVHATRDLDGHSDGVLVREVGRSIDFISDLLFQ
jgi:hypothetical protein